MASSSGRAGSKAETREYIAETGARRNATKVASAADEAEAGYTILPFEWKSQPFFSREPSGMDGRPNFEQWLVRDAKSDRIQRFFSLFLRLLPNPSLSLKGSMAASWAKRHRGLTYVVISTLAYMVRRLRRPLQLTILPVIRQGGLINY
jgi:hypothetical protein